MLRFVFYYFLVDSMETTQNKAFSKFLSATAVNGPGHKTKGAAQQCARPLLTSPTRQIRANQRT